MSKDRLDWTRVREQLEKAEAAMENGYSPNPDDVRKILRARADKLSQETTETKHGEVLQVMEFSLANESYALESRFIREVCTIRDLTPLPGTPSFVLGLINLRGQIVSVIDVKKFFDLPDKGITDLNKVIIVHDGMMEFGILADSILGVQSVQLTDIQPPLPTLNGIRELFLTGVTAEGLVILNAEKLLADKSIVVYEEP